MILKFPESMEWCVYGNRDGVGSHEPPESERISSHTIHRNIRMSMDRIQKNSPKSESGSYGFDAGIFSTLFWEVNVPGKIDWK